MKKKAGDRIEALDHNRVSAGSPDNSSSRNELCSKEKRNDEE
ncbi:MAG: hypothetical protein WC074_01360 [bacterium]